MAQKSRGMGGARLARKIRRGARYAMERHSRNVHQPLPIDPAILPRRRLGNGTWLLLLAAAFGLAVFLRSCYVRAAELEPELRLQWQDVVLGVSAVLLLVGVALAIAELGDYLLHRLFSRKDRP